MTKKEQLTVGASPLSDGLDDILRNLLYFYCKWDDAPMSAQVHLDKAIVDLVAMCPGFKPTNDEISEIINEATEHMQQLGYTPN